MLKAKKYDWKDSNMANFGGKEERSVKKKSAETEPAWAGTGKAVEVRVWRINKFKVEAWPKGDYGKFYTGDSYIVLNVYKVPGEVALKMDVHFWIGQFSSQDEYATAAYKTVELDTYHDDIPVQHREVQDYESEKFKSYFPFLTYMKGGCESGFNHVGVQAYAPRLLHLSTGTTKNVVQVKEVKLAKGSLNDHDSFVLDLGSRILCYNGPKANLFEKTKCTQYARELESTRNGRSKVETSDSISDLLPDANVHPKEAAKYTKADDKLLRLSDASGQMKLDLVDGVDLTKGLLNTNDIFFVDNGAELYIWCGLKSSVDERMHTMVHATKYLNSTNHPFAPFHIYMEGNEDKEFWDLFTD